MAIRMKITVSSAVLDRLPPIGSLILSSLPPYQAIRRIVAVRTLVGRRRAEIGLEAVSKALVPVGIMIPAWPKPAERSAPPPPREIGEVETPAKKARAQRIKAVALLQDDRDTDRLVSPVRLINGTAIDAIWRDPTDLNANRREPKQVRGVRAFDIVQYLFDMNSITRKQSRAARKIRDAFDRSDGVRIGYDRLQQASGGTMSDGPSSVTLEALEEFQAARAAIGKTLFEVVAFVVLNNNTLSGYAKYHKVHHYTAHTRLQCALDRLVDHIEATEEKRD